MNLLFFFFFSSPPLLSPPPPPVQLRHIHAKRHFHTRDGWAEFEHVDLLNLFTIKHRRTLGDEKPEENDDDIWQVSRLHKNTSRVNKRETNVTLHAAFSFFLRWKYIFLAQTLRWCDAGIQGFHSSKLVAADLRPPVWKIRVSKRRHRAEQISR